MSSPAIAAVPTPAPALGDVVLSVEDLATSFPGPNGTRLSAVRGVSFDLRRGKTMVLLGESGSGKSVTARSVMRLYGQKAAETTGHVRLLGNELTGLDERALRDVRGSRIALVPQDPTGALDPLRKIGSQLAEVLLRHGAVAHRRDVGKEVEHLLGLVGIPDPPRVAKSFPHELSGGMRQRAVIAIAVSCSPEVLIADEPTTALDVTVQAQILELFQELQREFGMAVLLVTHDVGVAEQVADDVGVMYAGRLVEQGRADEVLVNPTHPYTAALLAALPLPGMARGSLRPVQGQPPMVGEKFNGCAFADRCTKVIHVCREDEPLLRPAEDGHLVACKVAA
jgi:oligopeptide/dipeptide ABC transporter ATP-binding protein